QPAVLDEPAIRGDGVVHGGGKGVLGRPAVVGEQRRAARRDGNGGGEMAMRARRADDVAAPVQVEYDRAAPALRTEPLRADVPDDHARDLDVVRERKG